MSARDHLNGIRVSATVLCRWERSPQGGLRATWGRGCRVTADPGGERNSEAAVVLPAHERHAHAVIGFGGSARPPVGSWISRGFIAALYLLTAFAWIAVVVRA